MKIFLRVQLYKRKIKEKFIHKMNRVTTIFLKRCSVSFDYEKVTFFLSIVNCNFTKTTSKRSAQKKTTVLPKLRVCSP